MCIYIYMYTYMIWSGYQRPPRRFILHRDAYSMLKTGTLLQLLKRIAMLEFAVGLRGGRDLVLEDPKLSGEPQAPEPSWLFQRGLFVTIGNLPKRWFWLVQAAKK